MNISATGFEWLMAPLFVFTKSDRLFFLINWFAYLLMPGLIFSVFRKLGISGRVAWVWMWLLPLGYGYVLQAASICNDSVSVTFALATVHYALRARQTKSITDVWLAMLALGVCSGIKAVNLPLYLPLGLALLPALYILRSRIVASVGVVAVAALVSFLPTALFNIHYTSTWTGDPLNTEKCQINSKSTALVGNAIELVDENIAPPLLPSARRVQTAIWNHFPVALRKKLTADYPRFSLHFGELPQEETAGLGLGLMGILGVSLVASPFFKRRGHVPTPFTLGIAAAACIALLAFMLESGIGFSSARLLCPYYPFIVAAFLLFVPGQQLLVRTQWWRWLAIIAASTALLPLILTPSRPLLPICQLIDKVSARHPQNTSLARIRDVYTVYANRHDVLAPMRQVLPATASTVGFICGSDDSELSLWKPFGTRTVQHIVPSTTLSKADPEWIVVKANVLADATSESFETWLARNNCNAVSCATITSKVTAGPEKWYLVHTSRRGKIASAN